MSDLIERLRKGDVSGELSNEAASRLEAQQAEIARLQEAISNIKAEVDRPTGRFNHLKRVVALNCKVLGQKP